jgi:hypothetical protein
MVQSFAPNIAPSEAQMRLAIGQILSMPFAYNAPVIVLDFDPGTLENEKITGRFKDLTRSRVFSFEINKRSVTYKPFTPRIDSRGVDLKNWEDFSAGYSYRIDAGGAKREKAQCVKPTSYNCGSICINIKKSCRANAQDDFSQERLFKLNELRAKYLRRSTKPGILPEEEKEFLKKADELKKITEPLLIKEWEEVQRKREEYKTKKTREIVTTPPLVNLYETYEERQAKQEKLLMAEAKNKREQLIKDFGDELIFEGIKTPVSLFEEKPIESLLDEMTQIQKRVNKLTKKNPEEATFLLESTMERVVTAKKIVSDKLEEARQIVKSDSPIVVDVYYKASDEGLEALYKKGVEAFSQLVGINGFSSMASVSTGNIDQIRSLFDPGGNFGSFGGDPVFREKKEKYGKYTGGVVIAPGDNSIATVVHEMGHWLEWNNNTVSRKVLNFYNKRTAGESAVSLKEATGNRGYSKSEITKVDKWLHPYMGKVYTYGTEVLSMGLELMYKNPIYLAKNDPEMFDFIYSVVRQGN